MKGKEWEQERYTVLHNVVGKRRSHICFNIAIGLATKGEVLTIMYGALGVHHTNLDISQRRTSRCINRAIWLTVLSRLQALHLPCQLTIVKLLCGTATSSSMTAVAWAASRHQPANWRHSLLSQKKDDWSLHNFLLFLLGLSHYHAAIHYQQNILSPD
jgi:hypothetical protein